MGKFRDITGKRFGRLTVVSRAESKNSKTFWDCICDCGKSAKVHIYNLTIGKTQSCGCLNREIIVKNSKNHGLCAHPLYSIWKAVKRRCYNKNVSVFHYYGGRGIAICDEWICDFKNFYEWAIKNGYKSGLSIDRINNNGNYSPENCRWSTMSEQARNRRNSMVVSYNGEAKHLLEWCKILGLNYGTVKGRLNKSGWSVEKAFETPIM